MTLPLTVAPTQGFTSFLDFPGAHRPRDPGRRRRDPGHSLRRPLRHGPGGQRSEPGAYARAQAAARAILEADAVPITLGGGHGVPIPVFRALEGRGPITLVHVDAHIDWCHEVNGVREGYSSPIRRASEMPWIGGIVQIGMRGTGSARPEEVHAARAYGAEMITAYEVHEAGMGPVLDRIAEGRRYYLSIDADGLDPTIMPAVAAPVPGGLLFHQMRALIHDLVAKGRVLGMDVVEVAPARDLSGISCITAGRLVLNLIGAMARAGYFERD